MGCGNGDKPVASEGSEWRGGGGVGADGDCAWGDGGGEALENRNWKIEN